MPDPVLSVAALGRSLKTSERLARRIARDIIEQGLPEGATLPVESNMATKYGVGRSSVREALRLLESRGVITIRTGAGGGPTVRRPDPSDLADSLELILQFEQASLTEVLTARMAIESMAVRLAAEAITDEQLEVLQGSIDAIRNSDGEHQVFLEANMLFHRVAVEASGNKVLRYFAESLKHLADGAFAGISYGQGRQLAAADAHQLIVDALLTRNPPLAENAMRSHLGEASEYWTKYYADIVSKPVAWGLD